MIPLAAYLEAAMRVARFDRLHPDPAERESAANLAAWQAWRRQVPVSAVRTICRRRQIDQVRTDTHYGGLRTVSIDEADDNGWSIADTLGATDPDTHLDDVADMIDAHARTPADRRTLALLAAGWLQREIAYLEGVSESAIAHRLYKIRNTRRNP